MSNNTTQTMLESLITSKTRIKLLLKFFLNSNTTAYLRNLEAEFGESTNAIRIELNRLEKANLLMSHIAGNKKIYQANTNHPLFPEIHKILLKYVGIDRIIEQVIERLGNIKKVYVTGDFALGKPGKWIDLLFIGNQLNIDYLAKLVKKTENIIAKKIRYLIIGTNEEETYIKGRTDIFLIWKSEK